MTALRSVVYLSDATRELGAAELEQLLVSAREQNRRNAITGVLFYNGGNIMQCFEGPADAVEATYRRIRASRRHKNITELMNAPVAQRAFQEWDMALAQPTQSELLAMSTARWKARAEDPDASPGGDGWKLMLSFWRSARRF